MATRQLTQQEMQQIKDSVIASCISKGIKFGSPQYAPCVQLGYQDAIRQANQGKLGLWFGKVNSFVQSQGGITGLLQSVSSIASQYRGNTPNMQTPNQTDLTGGTQFPPGYGDTNPDDTKGDNMGLWLVLIILLIVLIIATVIYFNKKGKATA